MVKGGKLQSGKRGFVSPNGRGDRQLSGASGQHCPGCHGGRQFKLMKVEINKDWDDLPYAVVGKSAQNKNIIMMLDSGASPNLIKLKNIDLFSKIDTNDIIELQGIADVPVSTLGNINLNLFEEEATCHVVPDDTAIPHAGLVGSQFFSSHGAKIDYKNRVLEINDKKYPSKKPIKLRTGLCIYPLAANQHFLLKLGTQILERVIFLV